MSMKTELLVLLALLGIVFLLFAGSASAAVDFPADEAGISAYVKAKASIPNLDVVKPPCFATIERENKTAGYIIGTVAMDYHTEEQYPHVYVSTDGWIVAYYPVERPSSWLLPWQYYSAGGPISTTTLKEAIAKVIVCTGGDMTNLKYYDFRHPDATNMMLIVESFMGSGSEWFKVTIPTDFTVYRVDWSHYQDSDHWAYAYLDNAPTYFSAVYYNLNPNHANYGSFNPSVDFTKGKPHEVEQTKYAGTPSVGLVLEYAK